MGLRRFWSDEEVAWLVALYPHESTADVAFALRCSIHRAYNKAHALDLHKTDEFMASFLSGRGNVLQEGGKPHRFKPGHASWNKGTHWNAGGRSPLTRFKKNGKPHNTKPIGSYRITKDGTLQRKVREAKGCNSKRWRSIHELVWIAANGKVPRGHIVVFRPGMKTNVLEEITIERVECISYAENMRRNTLHRYPKPIAHAIQLRGALNRQINKRGANA